MSGYKKRGLLFWLFLPVLAGPLLYKKHKKRRQKNLLNKVMDLISNR